VTVGLLRKIMDKYGLSDCWRRINKERKQFTWRQLDRKNEGIETPLVDWIGG
jgi:hypothetical protein